MPIETASHIASLNSSNPASGDQLAQTDDHLRLIKTVLLTDFATIDSAITATPTQINSLGAMIKTDSDLQGSLVTAGTATAYTLATNTVFASVGAMDGKVVVFRAHTTSGATPTLNVDGLGAVSLKSISGTALPTGALLGGGLYAATYRNSATEFVVHGIFGVLPSTTFAGAVTVTTGGLTVSAGGATITGNSTITGTLGVSGALTVSAGGAAITGNSNVTGTFGVSSDFAVATNKFTVAAATGNTAIAGTLGVTGDLTAAAALSGATAAGAMLAAKADQGTGASPGASTSKVVQPGTQQYHPSAAKAWVRFHWTGAAIVVDSTYGVSSVSRNATGVYVVNFSPVFANAVYVSIANAQRNTTQGGYMVTPAIVSNTQCVLVVYDATGTAIDPAFVTAVFFGDQ